MESKSSNLAAEQTKNNLIIITMGKSKIIRNGEKVIFFEKRKEQKSSKKGMIKAQIRKGAFAICKQNAEEGKQKATKHMMLSLYFFEKLKAEEENRNELLKRTNAIDGYADKNNCSRKIARKRMSQDRRGYKRTEKKAA